MGQCPSRPNPTAPELPVDLVEEILLRFPPAEPASLLRAALVCKPWCRLVSEPGFRRRFREFHLHRSRLHELPRTPPTTLGFFCRMAARDGAEAARFMPTSTFCSPRGADLRLRHCRAIDARHGRVLLQLQCPSEAEASSETESALVVWDPISDERREELPAHTRWGHASRCRWSWNAAVLCAAAAAGGPCNHLDCHRGPFLVVFVDFHSTHNLFISTYSSDSGTWSDRIFALHPDDYVRVSSFPCAQVGNALYFASETSSTALKYDLCLHKPSVISIPPMHEHEHVFPCVLTTTEDGRLRCTALLHHGSKLYMWSRAEGGHAPWEPNYGWKQDRVIELRMLLRSNAIWDSPCIVGFADEAGVIFLKADDVHFTVDVNTKKVKKVYISKYITVDKALPYKSFYTPALGAAFRDAGPSEGGTNA